MLCPECREGHLEACYRLVPVIALLDGPQPVHPTPELVHLVCPCCQQLWYALPGETAETAYRRIYKEEPRT